MQFYDTARCKRISAAAYVRALEQSLERRPATEEPASLATTKDQAVYYFGEFHQLPLVLEAQLVTLRTLRPTHLVMEMFSVEQQPLLDGYAAGRLTLEQVQREYETSGDEGFDILHHYGALLRQAREQGTRVVGGFVPRRYAKRMANLPVDGSRDALEHELLEELVGKGWAGMVQTWHSLKESPRFAAHYAYFRHLLGDAQDTPKMRNIFDAQLLKDAALAWSVERISGEPDRPAVCQDQPLVYVVCGSGHSDYGYGAPSLRAHPFLISCQPEDDDSDKSDWSNLAHFVLLVPSQDGQEDPEQQQQQQEQEEQKLADCLQQQARYAGHGANDDGGDHEAVARGSLEECQPITQAHRAHALPSTDFLGQIDCPLRCRRRLSPSGLPAVPLSPSSAQERTRSLLSIDDMPAMDSRRWNDSIGSISSTSSSTFSSTGTKKDAESLHSPALNDKLVSISDAPRVPARRPSVPREAPPMPPPKEIGLLQTAPARDVINKTTATTAIIDIPSSPTKDTRNESAGTSTSSFSTIYAALSAKQTAFFAVRRNRWLCGGVCGFLFFGTLILLLVAYLAIPPYIQHIFQTFSTDGAWPAADFNLLLEDRFHFNVSYPMSLSNYVPTTIRFQEPFVFCTEGVDVITIDFPDIHFGPTERFHLQHNFTSHILNGTKWESLWKRWIGNAFTPESDNTTVTTTDTKWTFRSTVTLEMMGFRWHNIVIEKEMVWNGGMSSGSAPMTMELLNWKLYGGLQSPGLHLDLRLNNTGIVGINAGNLELYITSLYRQNQTYTDPVDLLRVQLPNFHYRPGSNNITIDNNFLLSNLNSVSASMQIGTNFLRNKTTFLVIQNLSARYPWLPKGATWVNSVLQSLSFVLQLNRREELTSFLWNRANKLMDVSTSFHQVFGENDEGTGSAGMSSIIRELLPGNNPDRQELTPTTVGKSANDSTIPPLISSSGIQASDEEAMDRLEAKKREKLANEGFLESSSPVSHNDGNASTTE